ncbi:MAG TPA: trypsin-like peptidase domain-containing protein [Candidatus Didemnitutus sp.]|nr:trypsin-like peptidase domain-containing protein [Candidatus Didemnitutus sp.]
MNTPARFLRVLSCLVLAVGFAGALFSEEAAGEKAEKPAANAVENSVVKIFATMRYPDPFKPWSKQAPKDITGTGVVIEGKRILTNAHVALYASQVQVQANQSGDKLPATVEFVAPGIDLAVLKLEDETFFDTHPAIVRAPKLPLVKDNVMVYGFPTGGTSLSITKGIVSRIEFTGYGFPVSGLRIQIDAAINPGNSGGPALAGDEMIGLAFSRLGGADNIGYIIPCEEIEIFLKDIADGHYDGKPAMHDMLQSFENPALRTWLKLPKTTEGIIVNHADSPDANYPLKKWDVITRIGDIPIDNEGMIKVSDQLRVRFPYAIQKLGAKSTVPLTIVRAGKEMTVALPVPTDRPMLIPDLEGEYPPYFIYGPLVFSTATAQLVNPIVANTKAVSLFVGLGNPLVTRRGDKPAFPGEELVVVSSPFFPHKLAKGYDNPISRVVSKVNGTAVKNLGHLVTLLRDATDEFIVFEFAGRGGESLVFPRKDIVAATDEILNDNGVRAQGSADTLAIWNEKAPKAPGTK